MPDPNVDHGLAFRATLVAVRPVNRPWLRAVYSFEVLSSTEWNPTAPFAPTAFFDITATIERKVAALAAYEDEMRQSPHPRSPETVRALAQFRGTQVGVAYAEGLVRHAEPAIYCVGSGFPCWRRTAGAASLPSSARSCGSSAPPGTTL